MHALGGSSWRGCDLIWHGPARSLSSCCSTEEDVVPRRHRPRSGVEFHTPKQRRRYWTCATRKRTSSVRRILSAPSIYSSRCFVCPTVQPTDCCTTLRSTRTAFERHGTNYGRCCTAPSEMLPRSRLQKVYLWLQELRGPGLQRRRRGLISRRAPPRFSTKLVRAALG